MFTKKFFSTVIVAAAALVLSISAGAQVTLNLKNVTVGDAITALNRTHGYSVSVNSGDVDLKKVISVSATDSPVKDVLDQIFKGQQIAYSINGKIISVSKKDAPAPLAGVVTDETGEPLVGAGIRVKGTDKGFISDLDGKFVLEGVKYPATLVVSFIGYSDQEVPVSGKERSVNVIFTNSMNVLNEVVVVGYGTQKRVNLTGAVSVVDGKDLNARPVTNAAAAIQGADPSLVLTMGNGSIEGDNFNLSIRGATSISSSTVSPLVLIDGIEGSLGQLNPNDIESVSILKDASACAIYGAKASAGVVIVNTKNGSSDKSQITYNGRFSVSSNTTSTDFLTTGYDYVMMCNEYSLPRYGFKTWSYTDQEIEWLKERRGDVTEDPSRPWVIPDPTGRYTWSYLGNYDWYGYMFKRTRPETEHNINVRGGNDKVKYYISGRYLYREGIFNQGCEDIYNGLNFRSKIDAKITDWLDYSANVSLERTDYKYGGISEQDGSQGFQSAGILWNVTQNVGPMFPWLNPDGTVNMNTGYMQDATSPIFSGRGGVWMDGNNRNSRKNNYYTVTNRLTASIVKGLKLTVDYTYRRRDRNESYRNLPTANAYNNIEKGLYYAKDATTKYGVGYFYNGTVYDYYWEKRYYQDGNVANAYLSYDGTFGSHHVSATAGGNFEDYYSSQVNIRQKDLFDRNLSYFDKNTMPTITNEAGESGLMNLDVLSQSNSSYRTLGFFGRVNYDYKGKYLLEISGRYDGSSRFTAGDRWGFFPSASAGWRISEEPFWAGIKDYVNKAKVRLSYGSLGNQQVSNYYYWDTISTSTMSYTFGGTKVSYASASDPKSSHLTWETVTTKNIGVDLGFFRDRLNVTADVYVRDTKNMLTSAMTLPAVYGAAEPKENAADLQTRGFELSLSWRDSFSLAGKPFSYGVTATLGDSQSFITRFDNETKLLSDYYVGQRLGDIWGYTTDGLLQNEIECEEYAQRITYNSMNKEVSNCVAPYNKYMPGDVKYVDRNGDGRIDSGSNTVDDPGDRVIIGNNLPRYNYGLRADLSWMGFDFSVFLQGVGKIDWMPASSCVYFWGLYSYQRPSFISKDIAPQSWSSEEGADNSNAYFPRHRSRAANGSGTLSTSNDRYLQNAAYCRLKNLTLGYTIPFKSKAISKARVYFSGENLGYISPLKKHCTTVDPEVATNTAADDCMYPFSKVVSFGVDITF